MQRYTTVVKSPSKRAEEKSLAVSTNRAIYLKSQPIKSSNECSSSPLTNSDSSDTNNETVTLTNANSSFGNNTPRYGRPGRRFFNGKSKSAVVSRSASNTRMTAEQIYVNHDSSDEDQYTSETDDLDSDEDSKLVYRTCMEHPPTKGICLKKSISRPECALKNFQFASTDSKVQSSRRFVKNNRLRSSKSMSHCKSEDFQSNEEDEENEESLYYRQLDGHMKIGKLSRFKVIKSKSNSALQSVTHNLNRKYDPSYMHQNDIKQVKGTQRDDQITNQLQLNELAERLKFIEQKLRESELNSEKKLRTIGNIQPSYQAQYPFSQSNIHQSNYYSQAKDLQQSNISAPTSSQNKDDMYLQNAQFYSRICPSNSFGDCGEINLQSKNEKNKRHFFSSAKSAVKNSRSIPSLFISNKSEKSSEEKLPGSHSLKSSSSKIWKPFNILSNQITNLVDDKLRGRWSSSKSVKSTSVRSNSICSSVPNKRLDQQIKSDIKPLYGPIFNNRKDVSSNKFINNELSSRKNSQKSTASSQNDLARSANCSSNSSRFSSMRHLTETNQSKPQKSRAYSTPNEEIFNLLSLPFMDEEELSKSNEPDRFEQSYKEIGSQALKEIEEFEKLLAHKFINNQPK